MKFSELVKPTERQREFFRAIDTHRYTLYGGAKGGGKSYILRWALVRQLMKWADKGFRGVRVGLFCEDYTTLKDRQITKIQYEFPAWLGRLSNNNIEGMSFVLDNDWGGGVIALRNLDDVSKYASSEFAAVAIDELTKNQRVVFDQFRGIMRWPGIEDTKFMAATNPGEIGHEWVKKIWIDRALGAEDPAPEDVAFVKSLPTDNPHNAKAYLDELQRLPENLRKAYLEGNWDVFEGQYFSEWDKEKHVCEPFKVPDSWFRYRSIDPSGRSGTTSCHWYAVDYDGRVWCYREYFETGLDADQHAKNIAKLSMDKESVIEPYRYTVMDTAAFAKGGYSETMAEIYERNGVQGLVQAMKERIVGWNAVHTFLRWDRNTQPKLKIFKTCVNLIREIPLAQHDELHPEDVDDMRKGAEHMDALDDLRYFLRTLREQHSPKPMSVVERRIREMKETENIADYSYMRH